MLAIVLSIQRGTSQISPDDNKKYRAVWTADAKGEFIIASAWEAIRKTSNAVRWHKHIQFQPYITKNFLVSHSWQIKNS